MPIAAISTALQLATTDEFTAHRDPSQAQGDEASPAAAPKGRAGCVGGYAVIPRGRLADRRPVAAAWALAGTDLSCERRVPAWANRLERLACSASCWTSRSFCRLYQADGRRRCAALTTTRAVTGQQKRSYRPARTDEEEAAPLRDGVRQHRGCLGLWSP
jgi:hypothetical protein